MISSPGFVVGILKTFSVGFYRQVRCHRRLDSGTRTENLAFDFVCKIDRTLLDGTFSARFCRQARYQKERPAQKTSISRSRSSSNVKILSFSYSK